MTNPGMQGWFTIQKSFNLINYTDRPKKKKKIASILRDAEKKIDKIKHSLIIKISVNKKQRGTFTT